MQSAVENYSFLDKQFAHLLLRICANAGCTLDKAQKASLTELAQLTSASTRAGVIALPLIDLDPAIDLTLLGNIPALGKSGDYAPLIIEDGHIWLNRYWNYETRLTSALQQRLHTLQLNTTQTSAISQQLSTWFSEANTAINSSDPSDPIDWQQRAIALAACSRFMIISGGPGTGKTTTVTRLLALLIGEIGIKPNRVLLAAPTGKAAMRLQESISHAKNHAGISASIAAQMPEQASTLHRLLGYIPGKTSFRHHAHNTLAADVVIVDEASMIDISLMTHLFEAVSNKTQLILLGDKDQLASVETGSIFRDLCATADNQHSTSRQQQITALTQTAPLGITADEVFPADQQPAQTTTTLHDHIVVLQKSWRFTADSGIGQLSAAVRNGQEDKSAQLLRQSWPDITWHENENGSLAMDSLVSSWTDYLSNMLQSPSHTQQNDTWRHEVFTAFNRFRILSPLRKGPSGTEHINQQISQYIRRKQGRNSQSPWFAGRPVMVMQNDYRQNLFNGDIGLTLKDASGQLRVWFPEQEGFRAIAPVRLPAHETAWAMTIHKSQGSEFDEVFLILPEDEESRILGRELLYTGITRARKQIHLSGKLSVLKRAIQQTLPPSSRIRQRLDQAKPATPKINIISVK